MCRRDLLKLVLVLVQILISAGVIGSFPQIRYLADQVHQPVNASGYMLQHSPADVLDVIRFKIQLALEIIKRCPLHRSDPQIHHTGLAWYFATGSIW